MSLTINDLSVNKELNHEESAAVRGGATPITAGGLQIEFSPLGGGIFNFNKAAQIAGGGRVEPAEDYIDSAH